MKKAWDQLASDLEVSRKENPELKKAMVALTAEREALRRTVAEDKELQEEMGEAIVLEHTRGFKKVVRQVSHLLNVSTEGVDFGPRKDVYQGQSVPLGVIPAGTFLDDEPAEAEATKAGADATVSGEMPEGNPTAPLIIDANIVHIG